MLRHRIEVKGALILLSWVRAATAGCPHPCEIGVGPMAVSPALPICAQARVGEDGCECGAYFAIYNGCTEPIETTDATFCHPGACRSVAPNGPEQFVSGRKAR
jgi:hypothetical protein